MEGVALWVILASMNPGYFYDTEHCGCKWSSK